MLLANDIGYVILARYLCAMPYWHVSFSCFSLDLGFNKLDLQKKEKHTAIRLPTLYAHLLTLLRSSSSTLRAALALYHRYTTFTEERKEKGGFKF